MLRHLLECRRHYREGVAFITERVAPARALVPSVLGATAQRDHASDVASEPRLAVMAHAAPWAAKLRDVPVPHPGNNHPRSEEHTSELQSLMRISYAVFCLKKKKIINNI